MSDLPRIAIPDSARCPFCHTQYDSVFDNRPKSMTTLRGIYLCPCNGPSILENGILTVAPIDVIKRCSSYDAMKAQAQRDAKNMWG